MIIKHECGNDSAGYGFYYYENNSKKGNNLVGKLKYNKYDGIQFLYDQPEEDYYYFNLKPGQSDVLLNKRTSKLTKQKFTHVVKAEKLS